MSTNREPLRSDGRSRREPARRLRQSHWLSLAFATVVGVGVLWPALCPSSHPEPRGVVLISIDTLRADRLGCYGFPRPATPNIDALARDSALFENAISPVPVTLPAHCSMLTGTLPPRHGVRSNFRHVLKQSSVTLQEVLGEAGYETGAVVSSVSLASRTGAGQGFDDYREVLGRDAEGRQKVERSCEESNRLALEWLQSRKGERFFLFLHYFEPHREYEPPEPFDSDFADDPYTGEVAYADHCLGEFFGQLRELGLFDSSLIVLTSDHGEMLGEHGETDHSFFIYESALHVPLLFRLPGGGQARRLEAPAGLADLVPTICSLMGVEAPEGVQGEDLSVQVRGGDAAQGERHLYSESLTPTEYGGNTLLGVRTQRWKYIQTTRPELYDLEADPGEERNLAGAEPGRARGMRGVLEAILAESDRGGEAGGATTVDGQTLMQLQSLGYVGGRVEDDIEFDTDREDPKDLIEFHEEVLAMTLLLRSPAGIETAMAMNRHLASERPGFFMGHLSVAQRLESMGRSREALLEYDAAIRTATGEPQVWFARAVARRSAGDWEGMLSDVDEVLRLDDEHAFAYAHRAEALLRAGRFDEALADISAAVRLNPEEARHWCGRGTVYTRIGDLPAAIADYQRCMELLPADSPQRAHIERGLREARSTGGPAAR